MIIKCDKFEFLIVGIGLNTNTAPKNKDFKSTCLKNIINKKIDNKKILNKIIIIYKKFLNDTKKQSFSELKRKYK